MDVFNAACESSDVFVSAAMKTSRYKGHCKPGPRTSLEKKGGNNRGTTQYPPFVAIHVVQYFSVST